MRGAKSERRAMYNQRRSLTARARAIRVRQQVYAAQQLFEPGLVTQVIQSRIPAKPDQGHIVLLEGLFKLFERGRSFAHTSVGNRQPDRRDMLPRRQLRQPFDQGVCLLDAASAGKSMRQS